MKRLLFGVLFVALSLFAEPGKEAEVPQPEGKAAEYYGILLKRPRPGYLFERFYNSWMEQHDLSDLEPFLKSNDSDESVLLRAFYHEMRHEPIQAAELYAGLLADRPDWLEVLYYKAAADAERGLYVEAVEGLEKLLALEPAEKMELDALTLLGRALLRAGKRDEGVAAWKRLLAASGMDADVAEELIDLQLAEGLYDEALKLCDRLLETSDDNFRKVMLRMHRAAILVRLDRRSDAVEGLREAFGLTGQGSWLQRDVLARIEQLFRGADDLSGLASLYESMLEKRSGDPALLRAHADALAACGEDEKALETARELVRLMPDLREVKEWYAGMLFDQGRSEEVIGLLEDFLKRYPDDNALRMRMAAVYHREGEDEKVVEWLRAFVEHSEKKVPDYLQAARMLARYGLDNEATFIYLDLLNAYPKSLEGREAIAFHLGSMGQATQAWKHYEELGKSCDLDTLLRLVSSLRTIRDGAGARKLLENRKDDFDGDFRFATVFFDTAVVLKKTEECLQYGLKRIDLAQTMEERELSVSALAYWMKRQNLVGEWIGRLTEKTDLETGRIWLLASLHGVQKDSDAAGEVLVAALEKKPDNEDLMECRLQLAKRERDWATAESILLELLEKNPETRTARIRDLVQVLQRAGKHEAALEWVEVWKKASPHAIRPYELERDVLVAANRREEAIESMRRAVLRFDESKELKASLGSLYEQSGRWLEAEQSYWRMLNAEETLDARLGHLANIIRVNQRQNKMEVLIEELERRAENSKKAAFPLLGLAECYRINHREKERASVLDRVLELRPNDVAVLREKAKLEEELGNYDAARALMMRVADSDSTGRAFRKVVEFELLYGDAERAKTMMDDPRIAGDADGFIDLVEALVKKGCWEPLIEPLRQRAVLEVEDYRFAYLHALVLEESGRAGEAAQLFASLLNVEQERPGVKPPKVSAALRTPNTYGNYLDLFSDELFQMYQSLGSGRTHAYAYRQQNRYRGYSSGTGSKIYPANLKFIESYVLAHLQGIVASLPEGEREAWLSKTGLEEEFGYARLLLIDPNKPTHQVAWWEAAFALYPDSNELRTMQTLMMPQTLQTEEAFRDAVARIPEEHPLVAFQILSQGIGKFPALQDLLPEVAARAASSSEDLQQISGILLRAVRSASSDQPLAPELIELLETTKKRAEELEGVSEEVKQQLGFAQAIVDGDAAGILEIQKKAFYKNSSFGLGTVMYQGIPSGYRPGVYYSLFGNGQNQFPPQRLLNAQVHMLQILGQFAEGTTLGKVGGTELRAAAEADDDAFFRLLVLAQLDASDEALARAAQTLEKKESPTIDEQYTLACWHTEKNPERSFELLLAAWKGCKDRTQRTFMIQKLLASASQIEEIPEALKPDLVAEVTQMIPSVGANRSQRMLLMGIMESLEMPIDALLATQATGSSRSGRRSQSVTRPPSPYQRVRTLLDKGKTEAAVQRVATMLRNESLQQIHGGNTNFRRNYHLNNSLNLIKQKKLEDLLLERLRPGNEPSPRQRFEYAFACEKLGKDDEALSGYRKLHELRPDWSGVSVQLCGLLAMDDPEAAQELLSSLPANMAGQMLSQSQQRMNNSSVSYEKRLAYIALLVGQLEKSASVGQNETAQYCNTLENILAQNSWYGGSPAQLPRLFDPLEAGILAPDWQPPENPSGNARYLKDETLTKIQQQRRELYLEFCRIRAELPGQQRSGFAALVAYMNYVGMEVDHEEMMRLAKKSLLAPSGINHYWYSSNNRGRRIPPLEFYLVGLHEAGHFGEAEKLLAEMASDNPDHQMLKGILEILAAETDADYLARVEKTLKTVVQNNGVAELVLRLPELGGRPVGLDELLWNQMRDWNKKNQTHLSTQLLNSWVALKKKDSAPEDLVRFLERYLDELFTEAEERIIAKAGEGGVTYQNHQAICQRYSQAQQVFSRVDLPVEVLPALLDKLSYYDRRIQNGGAARSLVQRYLTAGVDYGWMEKMGFLGELDAFNLYLFPENSQPIFTDLISRLSGDKGKPILEKINALEQQTFGSGLVKTLLEASNNNKRPALVLVYLAGYADELVANPKKQDELFEWLYSFGNRYGTQLDASPDDSEATLEMKARYSGWKLRSGLERVEQLENLKMAAAIQNWYQWRNKWREASRLIVASDPDKAFELFRHMVRLEKQVSLVQGQTYNEKSTLQQVFQNPKGTRQELAFAQRIAAESGSDAAEEWYKGYVSQWVSRLFSRIEQERRKQGDEYKVARLLAGKECLLELLASSSEPSFMAVKNTVNRIDRGDYSKLAEWLDGQELPDTDPKRLLRIYLHATPEDDPWLKTFFANKERSAKERIDAYNWLAGRGSDKPKMLDRPELLLDLVGLLSEDGQAKLPSGTYQLLIRHAMEMEPGAERQTLAKEVLRLWRADRVQASRTDRTTLFMLVDLAASVGKTAEAINFLSRGELPLYPQTYAVALRHGFDGFVEKKLLQNILLLKNSYFTSKVWISSEALEHGQAIADGVEDEELRLLVQLFIARLPIKVEKKTQIDDDQVAERLALAMDTLQRPETMRWVVLNFNSGKTKKMMAEFNLRYLKKISPVEILRKRDSTEIQTYVDYVLHLLAEKDSEVLEKQIRLIEKDYVREMGYSQKSQWVIPAMVRYAFIYGNEELVDVAYKLAVKYQTSRNSSADTSRSAIEKGLGLVDFDLSPLKLETLSAAERLKAYDEFDNHLKSSVSNQLLVQFKLLGINHASRSRERTPIRKIYVDEWVGNAETDTFVPLFETIIKWARVNDHVNADNLLLEEYIQTLPTGSLMLDQVKASVSLYLMDNPENITDARRKPIERYLSRPDLDDAEKIRFALRFRQRVKDQVIPAAAEIKAALDRNADLAEKHGAALQVIFHKAVQPLPEAGQEEASEQEDEMGEVVL